MDNLELIGQALLMGAASWRLASLLVHEPGPFDVFLHIRSVAHNVNSAFLHGIFACVWCMGIWTTILTTGLWFVHPAIVMVLAAMSVVVIIERWNRD